MRQSLVIALLSALFVSGVVITLTSSSSGKFFADQVTDEVSGDAQGSYTYFAFEREWPGTVCKTNTCTSAYMGNFNSKNFNLHGLWPSGLASNVCSYPQDCGTSTFSFSNINSNTATYMKAYWVGLYSSQQTFLNHEWTKHGTCYSDSQNDYFTKAVDLHQKYNPITALAAKNIVPSNSKTYSVADVQSALDSGFGTKVVLQCKKIDGNQYFFAFDMYFDKSLTSTIVQPCTKATSCSTSSPIYFPTV